MTRQEFKDIISKIQKFQDECAKLASMNIHIFSSSIFQSIVDAFFELFEVQFGTENKETLEWFLFNAEEGDCTIDQLYDIVILGKDYYLSENFKNLQTPEINKTEEKLSVLTLLKILKQISNNGKL